MIDFISRVVGRVTTAVIQPRVPSLYEPPRAYSGPLWTGSGRAKADREYESDTAIESESGHVSSRPQLEPLRVVHDSLRELPKESEHERPRLTIRHSRLITRSPSLHQVERKHVGLGSPATAPAVPVSINGVLEQAKSADEATASQPRPTVATRAGRTSLPLRSSVERGEHLSFASEETNSPLRSASRSQIESSHARNQNKAPILPATAAAARIEPAAQLQAGSVRKASGGYLNSANSSPSLPDRLASEPTIEVTIGRVEVRAVVASPTPRRAERPRTKPSLSLDDYLKQRTRGKR